MQDHRRWVKIIVRVVISLVILGLIAILAIVGGHWFGPVEAWIERQVVHTRAEIRNPIETPT